MGSATVTELSWCPPWAPTGLCSCRPSLQSLPPHPDVGTSWSHRARRRWKASDAEGLYARDGGPWGVRHHVSVRVAAGSGKLRGGLQKWFSGIWHNMEEMCLFEAWKVEMPNSSLG